MSDKQPPNKKEDELLYVAKHQEPPEQYNPIDWSSYYEESPKDRFKRKALENPFVPTGAVLTAIVLGFGLWTMKTKNQQLSQHMMRTRILAQGATVACMIGAAIYEKAN